MKMRNEKGITLVALSVMIIVILIITTIIVYSGKSSMENARLTRFIKELEVMQAQVEVINKKYKEEIEILQDGEEFTLVGKELTELEYENEAFEGAEETDTSGYRYYDIDTLEQLGISGFEREYLVNVKTKKVIAIKPIKIENKKYYTLDQVAPSYKVGKLERQENVKIENITYTETNTGYDIKLENIQCSEYVAKYTVRYKAENEANYKVAGENVTGSNFTFSVTQKGKYYIKIIDAAGMTTTTPEIMLEIR